MRVPSSALKIIEVQASALPAPKPASAPANVSAISLLFIALNLPQTVLLEDHAGVFDLAFDRFGADRAARRNGWTYLYGRLVKKQRRSPTAPGRKARARTTFGSHSVRRGLGWDSASPSWPGLTPAIHENTAASS